MSNIDSTWSALLNRARADDDSALGQLVEHYRNYLKLACSQRTWTATATWT
ncbi:MAG: hypothetical protein IID44_17235 [Planctomycetes bacterium]|nr:hypothetical protein [Planctomycetota bacterium]